MFGSLCEETGERVRLDWKVEEPPSNLHDGRAMFSYRFFKGKHFNLLELESLISLLRRVTREGIQERRLADSRVVLGAVSKGRSSLRKINFLLRKQGFLCLACDIALELVWVPTWSNPADAPSRNMPKVGTQHCQSFRPHRPQFSRQPMPSLCWICSVSHCRPRPTRQKNMYASLNLPEPSVVRK